MNGSHDLHHLQVDQGGGDHGGDGGGGGDGVQLKKGPWTAAEDSVLTEYVRKHGEGNWNAVQRNTGLARCGKSCRLRWANHLRPNLKKGAFSPEEERLIVELHAQLGNKWARMAAQLPGRTDNEIKNYWNTRVKRRHRQGLPLYPQEIQTQQHGGNHHHHHPYHHQQYHHHQQQQQQQLLQQQTPQSSHSHHSHHHQSPVSTPTTPTSSFTFSTTPTAAHHHHYFSRSPTPNCLSPTPPPPLSPSSALHSPHYHHHHHQTLPTLSLFDSTTTTTTNPTSFNVIHRAPPILQTPLRFKRFHAGTTNSSSATTTNSPGSTTTAANNFNTNYSNVHNNNNNNNNNFNTNTYQNGNFSLPYSTFLRSSTSVSTPPPPQQPNCNAFSNTNSSTVLMSLHQQPPFTSNHNMVSFVSNNSSTSNILRTQFEKDYNSSSTNNNFPNNSVFAMKPELPSSQCYSHHHNGSSQELAFIDNNNDQKLSLSGSVGSGLLEDLLDETTAHMSNSMEDKSEFSGFNNHWSDSNSLNLSPGTLKPKEETAEAVDQINNNNNTMQEDLSKIFNSINNPSMQLPAEWYNDTGTGSAEEASNGHSSVVTTDDNNMISLDQMHQIASMFRVDDSSSQELDHHHLTNPGGLPGIC
ncbi:hypothetical protein Ddye_027523 [Dipteronia dyeriana]|uniref:Uncharacterized protein n=1 Tax=Dipteronia dyeriana TaxID=168575 RepID=A0AAD9TQ28_9ROSI|nr:hypothetical protein Ddye_027523 [Dipteronia dyeriana]